MVLLVKNLPGNAGDARDAGLIPGLGRSCRVGNGHSTILAWKWWVPLNLIFLSISVMKGLGVAKVQPRGFWKPLYWLHHYHQKVAWSELAGCSQLAGCSSADRRQDQGMPRRGSQKSIYTENCKLSGQVLAVPSGDSVY